MATATLTLLNNAWNGMGWKPSPEVSAPVRALPGPWYTSWDMYELERRAIFSRKWLLTTHKVRLTQPGDWIKYEIANYGYLVCKNQSGEIKGFQNACPNRKCQVVNSEKGNTQTFTCDCDDWSFDLDGNLVERQDAARDEKAHSLFPVHVHIDRNGFIWVNLDSAEEPEVPWTEDFIGVDQQPRHKLYNFDSYTFDHSWQMEGDYNWKILADNYNECYHCKTTHPDIPTISNVNSYEVECKGGAICHFGNATQEQIDSGFMVSSTYHFPNCSCNVLPNFFFMQRFVPLSPGKSIMSYEVYRHKDAKDEEFQVIDAIYKRIMSEDKVLCAKAQKNINAGIFVNGELHPKMEAGPLYFQKLVRETLMAYHEVESDAGTEVWPCSKSFITKEE